MVSSPVAVRAKAAERASEFAGTVMMAPTRSPRSSAARCRAGLKTRPTRNGLPTPESIFHDAGDEVRVRNLRGVERQAISGPNADVGVRVGFEYIEAAGIVHAEVDARVIAEAERLPHP